MKPLYTKKNGTVNKMASVEVTMPASYPASNVTYDPTTSGLSATRVQGAIDELVSGTVLATVTADGVKTNSALLAELLATASGTTFNSKIVEDIPALNIEIVFHAVSISASKTFTKIDVRSDRTVTETITYASGAATLLRGDTTNGGLTVTNNSTNVPAAGTKFTLYK